MFNIKLIGAGQLGSRHLQALASISYPLDIEVIDPSDISRGLAKDRYELVAKNSSHKVSFKASLDSNIPTDLAIIATNSDVRRDAIEELLNVSDTKFLILEKLLFNKFFQYRDVENILLEKKVKAWVNCPMRIMPTYESIRSSMTKGPFFYRVTGSKFGLVTNAIHYIDHLAYLCGCNDFHLDISGLEPSYIESKRPGFIELNGVLRAKFFDGSVCEIICYPDGNAPIIVEIFNDKYRYIVRESEQKLWKSSYDTHWDWVVAPAPIPYQSQITNLVVDSIFASGTCGLTDYLSSSKYHLQLLGPLKEHLSLYSSKEFACNFT